MTRYFDVLTLNVRGMRNTVKRRTVFDFLGTLHVAIVFLQEVHLRDMGDVGMFSREWTKGDSVWSVGGVHSTGVGILFCFKEIRVEDVFVIDQGRAIGADIVWGTRKLRVIVVYGPQSPAERTNLFTLVEPFLVTNRQVIIGGDFNVELGKGGDASDQYISQLMVRCGLADGGKGVKPHIDSPTWRNSRGVAKRLDYLFFSRSLNLITGRTIPVFFSDHDGLLFRVDMDALTFGPGYWRLNVSVLEEKFFNQQFPLFFKGVLGLKPLCQGILEWWEVAKDRIKTFCLGYCKRKARRSKREMSHLQRLLEREYAKGNCGSTINENVCDSLKARLRHVSEGKARAFLARSRSEFIEQSETCSAAFFSSVRAKKARQVVTGFRDSQGIVVTEEGQVVRVATDHFRDSFKEKDVGRGDDFLELLDRQVPGDIVQALEVPLTVSELEGALNKMNKGKVPGIDGLPVELYAKFWSILGPVLLEVLTEVLQAGEMSGSLATGVISLLYKKGDRTEIGNWRPLTMLCVDYKLLAKVLTDRLGEAMPHVVHVDQTCAVPGRSTRWNLQLLRDAVAWAEDRNLPLMLVALDQTKAFDRVQWSFMFSILERLGFGKVFIRWLRTLYMDVGSKVVVNGYLGDFFRLQSGVRQGCPLSPLLYVLYMEPLAAAIRADPGVRGFLVPGSRGLRVKLSQYADDTTLLLDRDECLIRSLQIMEDFGRASGSKLNCAKSSVKFFGEWRERIDAPGGLAFCSGPIKVLGVSFESTKSASLSWARRLEAVERKVSLWKSRQLTFIGKVLVLKVDILPSLLYLAYIYPLPVSMRRPLMRLVFGFIWGGRYEYVARGRMLAGVEAGGRDVPHLTLKMDCIFVSTLCTEVAGPVVHPSGYFIRLFFSYQARELMAWNNLGPRAEQQPWHYRHAARWLRAHPEAAGPEVKLNHRTLYQEAREKINVGPVIGIPSKVWRRIQPKGLDNRLKDLNWLCLLRCLPVREIMHRHGLARSPVCPRPDCKDEETIRHVMWDCPFARGAWRRVEGWLGQSFPGLKMTWDGIERGSGPGEYWASFPVWLVVSLLKRNLWLARQDVVKNKCCSSIRGIIGKVRADMKGRMERDILKWGQHAALERWKGGLGLVE